MLVRNYAKPFCIAGFILAEIYMLLVVLAPYGHEPGLHLIAPLPAENPVPAGTPVPTGHLVTRIIGCGLFLGPCGALAGLGVGLVFSALLQSVRGGGGGPEKPAALLHSGEKPDP